MAAKINRKEFSKLGLADIIFLKSYLSGYLQHAHDEGRELLLQECQEALEERIDEQLLIQN